MSTSNQVLLSATIGFTLLVLVAEWVMLRSRGLGLHSVRVAGNRNSRAVAAANQNKALPPAASQSGEGGAAEDLKSALRRVG